MAVPSRKSRPVAAAGNSEKEGGWGLSKSVDGADLLLTAPVFFIYHLGVVFLSIRNGCDPLTALLLGLLGRSLGAYLGLTAAVGLGLYAAVRLLGLGGALSPGRVGLRLAEATGYALIMAIVARAVTAEVLGPRLVPLNPAAVVVVSMGAGFYEELAFRVILFGAGVFFIGRFTKGAQRFGLEIAWAFLCAAAFSGAHYVGGQEHFALGSFVFRVVCGLVLTLIYRLRGFATAVWTHAIYDVGVML